MGRQPHRRLLQLVQLARLPPCTESGRALLASPAAVTRQASSPDFSMRQVTRAPVEA